MLINREGNFATGFWNALVLTFALILLVIFGVNLYRWITAPPPEPVHVVQFANPLTGEVEEDRCLILLPPEVSEEPDYRLGEGEECRVP